ncbi:hypothetical protein ASE75_08100 [Sphingomonas sp. Leaf17]|uniref:hypothetical protein n=1 Tax=Sphingomonas sp. Leaf17 TaxID=1735683 RepID=UPI0006FEB77E|nr:hypothetical protein [Sphingomonas sp. Leaf17]KQM65008.1 hypothetical protein ASE75_08100 [Sphingomonas sp. Leaf17]
MRRILALTLMVTACGPADPAGNDGSAGAALEAAAVTAGLVPDPTRAVLTGLWSRDSDRMCIVAGSGRDLRVGAIVDYGEGAGCAASGTAQRSTDTLAITFGACRIDATFDGERIVFPAEVPAACESLCTGRASLAALDVAQVSESVSEARALRGTTGQALCGS